MRSTLALVASTAVLALAAAPASAAVFVGDYTVTAINSADPGLKVHATDLPGAINLNLAHPGSSQIVNLFKLWTDEGSVQLFEDTVPKPISVRFNFIFPSAFGGSVDGDTYGVWGVFQKGRVSWDGPTDLMFGKGGLLRVSLRDAHFNDDCAFCGLHDGPASGATISAKFTLLANAVPEPATWAMMITGFGLVGMSIRRRRALGLTA
ncbi:MAG TPA: PEPxxWA-CTERM sorting domain-containing protein [Phenylobacterium sp.]|nr:PEPxxWA-CTERM sorting domain-containing protein [Phenylobacterium sp.]